MSNYLKIATIGPKPLELSIQIRPQDVADQMIHHWRNEFAQVLPDKPNLIVVPEKCDCPRNWPLAKQHEYYEIRKNQVLDIFTQTAKEHNCYIVYAAIRKTDDGDWHNSSVVIDRRGNLAGTYHKNHLMIEEATEGSILYGKDVSIIQCDFGRVACAICFDLNFDQLRLKYATAKPDLLIFSSNYHGGELMQAYWAYSCRCHFVGAVTGLPCQIRNPFGEVLGSSTNYRDYTVGMVNLDCCLAHYDGNWDKLKTLKAHYGTQVNIHDPGQIGSVLISSLVEDKTATELAREFEIELLDDYFARSLGHRDTFIGE